MEQAFRRGGEAGERAVEEESARARSYLQALGEQLGTTAQQIEDISRSEDDAKQQSL
jgi:predicted solute-binding protein